MITLATLESATAQEVFDQVKNHLLKQNEQSATSMGDCLYRQHNLKCVAGCLISDSEYRTEFEGVSWSSIVERGMATDTHLQLITDLQNTHDNYPPEDWEDQLQEVAEFHNLKF